MSIIVSPAEALGLSGAALDSRVMSAARHVSDVTFANIAERLKADAFANEIIYEHETGREAVRIMLRPMLAQREQLSYVHHVCLQINEALKQLPKLYLADYPGVRDIVRLGAEEERWLKEIWREDVHQRHNQIYGRLDAVCDFVSSSWQDTLKFMEPNLSGVGGIHYAPVSEQVVMRDVVPTLLAHDPGLVIELPQDQRDLFVQLLIDHSRVLGRKDCQLCFVEPRFEAGGPDEQGALSRYLSERHGLVITHADPRELVVRDGEVYCGDVRVDVAYRDYEMRDMIALEKELGRPLDGMKLLLKQNRVISSLVGDLDHKSGFEILTDHRIAEKLFSAEDCRLYERHVLWTRLVGPRQTTLPNRAVGDLLAFARENREQLVLKPNRAYGGDGVALGAGMTQAEWEKLLDEAAAKGSDPDASWVIQLATAIPVVEFPVIGEDKRVYNEPFYAVQGFAATEGGLGVMTRVSQKKVVNVAQHGGIAALLIAEQPMNLRIAKRPAAPMADAAVTLRQEIKTLLDIDHAIALLEWDEETYIPAAGRAERGEQIGTLESLRHNLLISDRLGDLVGAAKPASESDPRLARELVLLQRARRQAYAVPEALVRKLAEARSIAHAAWDEARKENEYKIFARPFGTLLGLVRERAQALAKDGEPYDALLDEWEPGMTTSRLAPILKELRERLVPIVARAGEATARFAGTMQGRKFAAAGQWELSRFLLDLIGFDFVRGRLDATVHPFTMMAGHNDIRVTSRVDEGQLFSGLLATMHEGGHALYDQGFADGDAGTLMADGASAGLHESQSRLWENHVGRSAEFCALIHPKLRALFGSAMDGIDADTLFRAMNVVKPGVNRVSADELSYHLHIVLRTDLEMALLSGALSVADLPGAWNAASKALLGVVPESDRDGVLQDVHWAGAMFGYFPTYSIGSLYAAQFVQAYGMSADLSAQIRKGALAPLRTWLKAHVHEKGNNADAEEIVTAATGKGIDSEAWFAHAAAKGRAWS